MAISGNLQLHQAVQQGDAANELRSTLFNIEAINPDATAPAPRVVGTPADRFNRTAQGSAEEIQKAKKQVSAETPGSKNTRPGQKSKSGTTDAGVTDLVAEGILSAEAILSQSVITPTGTQTVCALEIDANTRNLFTELRQLTLGEDFQKLARFVPQFQQTFGTRNAWPGAAQFNGYYAILSPMFLSSYVPYCDTTADFSDEQVLDCFRPFRAVDGYPTIDGVPVWERQEWERIEYYNAFKLYRDMRYAFYNEADMLLTSRSLTVLAQAIDVTPGRLSYLSRVYHWGLRCDLYDAWMANQQQLRQNVRRSLMFDRHTKISQALVQKAYQALNRNVDKMSPKDALAMLELGLKYERLSQGLPADKVEGTNGSGAAMTGPSISIVNQTNGGSGAVQVAMPSTPEQQLQDNMQKPDTLLSVLAVLQRSNAFNTVLRGQEQAAEDAEEVVEELFAAETATPIDAEFTEITPSSPVVAQEEPMEEVSDEDLSAEDNPAPQIPTTGAPGFVAGTVSDPASALLRGFDGD